MRLHRLSLRAVGPFADPQEVDFDLLGASGMFLLEGPTGVGKTTVLDAITFALYGQGSRREVDPGRMHSHLADPGVRPHVELEFSLAATQYRIRRTPRHERAKRRGSGTITVDPTVSLVQREPGGAWVELTHDNAEAGTFIGELLGLSREQFAQVVALPQGQFARFLQADDDQRRALLTRLFGTELYDRVTEQISEQARVARAELAGAGQLIATQLAATCEAGELGSGEAAALTALLPGGPPALGAMLTELERRAAAIVADHAAATRAQQRIGRRLRRLEQTARTAQERSDRLSRLVAAHEQLARHEATRGGRDAAAAELSAARRAAPVAVLLAQLTSARAGVAAAVVTVDAATARLARTLDASAARAVDDCDELPALAARWHSEAAALAQLAAVEAQLPELVARCATLEYAVESATSAAAAAQARARELESWLGQLSCVVAAVAPLAGSAAAAAAEVTRARDQLAAATESAALEAQVAAAATEASSAVDQHQQAVDHHQELMTQRIAGMRGELAGLLVSGVACMVCGATQHPAPAPSTQVQVTPADLERAAHQRDRAQQVRAAAEADLAARRVRLAAAVARAGGLAPAVALAQLERCQEHSERAADASAVAADLAAMAGRWQRERDDATGQAATLAAQAAQARGELGALAAALAQDQAAVSAGRGGHARVADRRADLERAAACLNELISARHRAHTAQTGLADLTELVDRELQRAGWDSPAQAGAAARTEAQVTQLAQQVELWDHTAATLSGQLGAPDLVGLDPLDLEQAVKVAEDAALAVARVAEEARVVRAEVVAAARRMDRFAACCAALRTAVADYQKLESESAGLAELDRLVRGLDGRKRMTLTSYVLRYWFAQVVTAANLRLATMSSGKYELVRVEAGESRRDRVGLGLRVLDRHTGQERPTRSLSGGETFYTSLALALGLSDVVSSQAGGVALDTLFIDEGFGTLDGDTLEEVMSVLDDLRGNGRTIGVVSHVAELKERIPERLEVRRLRPDGPSQLRVIA